MLTVPTIELREHQKDVFWAMTTGPYKRGLYTVYFDFNC